MRHIKLSIYIFTFLLIPLCGQAETIKTGPGIASELWQGNVLTASFRTGMCFTPQGKAFGVLILRHASGQEDHYHLYGSIKNNAFELSHSSGHYFTGKLTGPSTMEGNIKLSNGLKMNLKGKRTLDATLKAPDCAPLE